MNGFNRVWVTNGTNIPHQATICVVNGTTMAPKRFVIVVNRLEPDPAAARNVTRVLVVPLGTTQPAPPEPVFVSNLADLQALRLPQ